MLENDRHQNLHTSSYRFRRSKKKKLLTPRTEKSYIYLKNVGCPSKNIEPHTITI